MFAKIGKFLSDVRQEMNKVTWPARDEIIGSTYIVIVLSGIMAGYIFGIDTILSNILKLILK
jgi:preprotein translocase subunit SecE